MKQSEAIDRCKHLQRVWGGTWEVARNDVLRRFIIRPVPSAYLEDEIQVFVIHPENIPAAAALSFYIEED